MLKAQNIERIAVIMAWHEMGWVGPPPTESESKSERLKQLKMGWVTKAVSQKRKAASKQGAAKHGSAGR